MIRKDLDKERLKRFFRGEHSEGDESYVNDIFCDDSAEKDLKSLLSDQFNELIKDDDKPSGSLDTILYRIHFNINSKISAKKSSVSRRIIKWSLRVASAIILPIAIYFGIHNYNEIQSKKGAWIEIKTPAWTKTQFKLPDGTTGWLNSNSRLQYKGNYDDDRLVMLNGEAFFNVEKNKKRPFRVQTNETLVTVLGTRFNIASYENEDMVEVVLEEGKLVFSDLEMKHTCTMNPNDLVAYDKTQKLFSAQVVQARKYLSWTEGKLVFRNDPIEVVSRKLARWFNIDVVINGSLSEVILLRATFVDESLDEVLDILKRSLPIDCRIENNSHRPDETFSKKKVIITPI